MQSKWFYQTAIISMMTLGASWGTYLLVQLYRVQNFTQLNILEVNAHGQAQIYGWIVMMLMGSIYLALPRLFHIQMPYPALTLPVWISMTLGMLLSTLGLLLQKPFILSLIGGMGILCASLFFAAQCSAFFARIAGKDMFYAKTAVFFLVLSAAYSFWHHCALILAADDRPSLLAQVANFQAPLRDMQVHGMGLFMVLAMLQLIFWEPPSALARRAWKWILTGVAGEIVIFLVYRFTNHHYVAAFLFLPWVSLFIGSLLLLVRGKIIQHVPIFARIACLWLFASEVMLLLLPLYSFWSHIPFSHAYYGAIRHAVTVGFLTQMILGMAPLLLARFVCSTALLSTTIKKASFILLNVGCILRVSLQIGTDFFPALFSMIFISGFFETLAIMVWGYPLLIILFQKIRFSTDSFAQPLAHTPLKQRT